MAAKELIKNLIAAEEASINLLSAIRRMGGIDRLTEENAEKFINFMEKPEIAAENCKYLRYGCPNDEAVKLLTFTIAREAGEGVGSYPVTPDGQETQGNYKLKYESGTLSIERAELFVMAGSNTNSRSSGTYPQQETAITGRSFSSAGRSWRSCREAIIS